MISCKAASDVDVTGRLEWWPVSAVAGSDDAVKRRVRDL